MTRKRQYLNALMAQPTAWIEASARRPNLHGMRRIHVLLHLIELRRRGRIAAYYDGVAQMEGWA